MKRLKKYTTSNNGKKLIIAAYNNDNDKIIELLTYQNTDINYFDDNSAVTTLDVAIMQDNIDLVKILLKRKDLNVNTSSYNSFSPLSESIIKGNDKISKLLLERDDLDVNHGEPILYAVIWNRANIFKLLLERDNIKLNVVREKDEDIICLSTINEWADYERTDILKLFRKQDIQRKILIKEPSLYHSFIKNKVRLHPAVKKEFNYIVTSLQLGLL